MLGRFVALVADFYGTQVDSTSAEYRFSHKKKNYPNLYCNFNA